MKVEDRTGRFEKLATLVNNSGTKIYEEFLVLIIDSDNDDSLLLHLDGRDTQMTVLGRQLRVPLPSWSTVTDITDFVGDNMFDDFIEQRVEMLRNERRIPLELYIPKTP